jgi:hypothetical protein
MYGEILRRFGGPAIIATDIVMKRKRSKIPGRGRVKGPSCTAKLGKPKFDFTVAFVDLLQYACLLRINEDPLFEARPSYGPRESLFHYLRAYDEIEKVDDRFFCHFCREIVTDAVEHAWVAHSDLVPAVYYPDQSPSYREDLLRQIHLANLHFELMHDSRVKCTYCGRVLPTFHCFYTHCRLMHYENIQTVEIRTPRELIVEHLTLTGKVSEGECRICSVRFDSDPELREHCWRAHGDEIALFLKHRPVNYGEETFAAAFHYGVICMNEITIGQICHGCIACGLCKIGFDDPGALCAVSAKTIEIWPLVVGDLRRTCSRC